jgi:hypothetical protein
LKDNATFAGISVNKINVTGRTELLKEAITQYNSYDSKDWEKSYFDKFSGGYIVANKQRIEHSNTSKNEKAKFEKEISMSKIFAKTGYKIEMLEEMPRIPSPDIKIDGLLADLKSVSSHNNIVKDAKKAVRKQGAEIVLFEFEKETKEIYIEIKKLLRMGIHGMYYFTGRESKIHIF